MASRQSPCAASGEAEPLRGFGEGFEAAPLRGFEAGFGFGEGFEAEPLRGFEAGFEAETFMVALDVAFLAVAVGNNSWRTTGALNTTLEFHGMFSVALFLVLTVFLVALATTASTSSFFFAGILASPSIAME